MSTFFKQLLYIPFYNLLIFFAWLTGGSVGWSIVILTVIIRTILLPSSIKAAKSSTKMQALQPKMNELREKYKGDQKKQSEELMKLYKEEGASPFGACLPLLIQLPIIWILYRVFMVGIDTSRYDLLYSFTPRPEILHNEFFGFNLSQPDLWILPILAGVLQFVVSWMSMPPQDKNRKSDPASQMTRQMTYLFPIMTIFIARSLPAALALYWIITTIYSVGQQWYVNKNIKKQGNQKTMTADSKSNKSIGKENSDKKNKSNNNQQKQTKSTKSDFYGRITKKRLDKKDRQKQVKVTIRTKK